MRSIFISSTFRDMQAERDVLHLQVFPELRKRLAAYGEDVQELDLRWGVDTSRMSEEKSGEFVVESCIDSIERCKPYMIVLLGSRYGWVPEQRTIDATADTRVQQWYETGSSITNATIPRKKYPARQPNASITALPTGLPTIPAMPEKAEEMPTARPAFFVNQ